MGESADRCDIVILSNNMSLQCFSLQKKFKAHPLYLAAKQTNGAQLWDEDILVPSDFGKMHSKPHLHHVARTEDLGGGTLNTLASA